MPFKGLLRVSMCNRPYMVRLQARVQVAAARARMQKQLAHCHNSCNLKGSAAKPSGIDTQRGMHGDAVVRPKGLPHATVQASTTTQPCLNQPHPFECHVGGHCADMKQNGEFSPGAGRVWLCTAASSLLRQQGPSPVARRAIPEAAAKAGRRQRP